MKILITGASSYVGARIYFDLQSLHEMVGTYNSYQLTSKFIHVDLTDKEQIEEVIQKSKPELIVHVANHASPRPAVNNEIGYTNLNLDSTKNLVTSANKIGAKFVFISSFAALNPNDIYGRLKLESEGITKQVKAGYLILRPSLIVGYSPNTTNDRPFNRILKCIDQKTSGEFDTSWKFTPTYVGHLSQIIQQAISQNIWNKTIPVIINEVVTQYQIAKDILQAFHLEVRPIDKKMNIPTIQPDIFVLKEFSLQPMNYSEMIKTIIQEIKNRESFTI